MPMTPAERAAAAAREDRELLDGLVMLLWRLRAHARGETPVVTE